MKYRLRMLKQKFDKLSPEAKLFITGGVIALIPAWLFGALIGVVTGKSILFFHSVFRILFYYTPLFLVCLVIGIGAAFFFYYIFPEKHKGVYDKMRNFTVSNEGTYGTAHLQSEEEQSQTLNFHSIEGGEKTSEMLIGLNMKEDRTITLTERAYDKMTGKMKQDFNPNIFLCGSQGSMKTAATINNYIEKCIKRGESMLINDTKGDLYENWHEYLEQEGYVVKGWNTKDFRFSDSWNILAELDYMDMTTFITAIMVNSGDRQESSNNFFDNADANLLRALFHYVYGDKNVAQADRNFGFAYRTFMTKTPDELEALFANEPNAKAAYGMFKNASKVSGNAFLSTGARLQIFQDRLVQEMTSHADIDMELPAIKKCAYFCISDDQTDSKDILNGMFFSFAIERMIKYADTHGKRVAVPWVRVVWDEFLNGVKVASLLRKLGTARSRGIGFIFGVQSIPYMQQVWPDTQWETILAACDVQILLGCNDLTTAKHFSDVSGQASIVVSTEAKNYRTIRVTDYVGNFRKNTSVGQRMVLNPDEVMGMDMWEQIVRLRGKQLVLCKKYLFYNRPVAKEVLAHTSPYYMHTPTYRKVQAGLSPNAPDCLRTLWVCGVVTKEEIVVRSFGDRNSDNPRPEFTPEYLVKNLTAGDLLNIFTADDLRKLFGTADMKGLMTLTGEAKNKGGVFPGRAPEPDFSFAMPNQEEPKPQSIAESQTEPEKPKEEAKPDVESETAGAENIMDGLLKRMNANPNAEAEIIMSNASQSGYDPKEEAKKPAKGLTVKDKKPVKKVTRR